MTELERIDRGKQAERELSLTNAIFDSIAKGCMDTLRELSRDEPWSGDKLSKVGTAWNTVEEVRTTLNNIVRDGKAAHDELARLNKQNRMSPQQKRWADMIDGTVNG